MQTMDAAADLPPLAGALPVSGKRRRDLFGLGLDLYERPIVLRKGLFGRFAIINDPAGIRRVLVENAANYPKTQMDLRFFKALFGGGLLGTEGETWRRHRRIMAPAFDPRSVAAYGPAIAAAGAAFRERWRALPDGAAVDMHEEMIHLTLEVISRTAFSTSSGDMIDLVNGTLRKGLDEAAKANLLDVLPIIGEWRMRARERRMARASAGMDSAIEALVADRAANMDQAPADLLTRLVAAQDLEGGAGLSPKEIRDEILTIFMAGHETTAGALSWTWYALSQRPAVLARLQAELDQVLGGRSPGPEDLPHLTFARQVIEEAMRLYPTAPGLSARIARADDEVCGEKIAKGTRIAVMPWVVHRHRQLWDDPETFDPDRFAPDKSRNRPRFAYLPFGGGPRVCIGQVLAMLAQDVSPRLAPEAEVVPMPRVTLGFRRGLPMRLERRTGG
jgi:cytochrome P450